jgi:hypothetical protein
MIAWLFIIIVSHHGLFWDGNWTMISTIRMEGCPAIAELRFDRQLA